MGVEKDPAILRQLAVKYRERASSHPAIARQLLEIAADMDCDAGRLEQASRALKLQTTDRMRQFAPTAGIGPDKVTPEMPA